MQKVTRIPEIGQSNLFVLWEGLVSFLFLDFEVEDAVEPLLYEVGELNEVEQGLAIIADVYTVNEGVLYESSKAVENLSKNRIVSFPATLIEAMNRVGKTLATSSLILFVEVPHELILLAGNNATCLFHTCRLKNLEPYFLSLVHKGLI